MLKEYLSKPPLLSKPVDGESLYFYLVVLEYEILRALIKEEENVQWPVYYISKWLIDAEMRYPKMEKLVLVLMIASRKLGPYFYSHTIRVLTNYPLRQVLQKPDALGHLVKWVIKLSQFDIEFQPLSAIKGQALIDFIVEFSHSPDERPEEALDTQSAKISQ